MATDQFKPALIVVDMQEDFCPPNGTLPVPHARLTIPTINHLLSLPFALKIATKDWHPADHISFSRTHPNKRAFLDTTTITNPFNPSESYASRLWPAHCIQHTPGAALIPELDAQKIDLVIEKGTRADVEMYSVFYAPLSNPRVGDTGLVERLRNEGITDVYVVGVAADYCVRATALDAQHEGFRTWVVEEGTRAVDEEKWEEVRRELGERGVGVVGVAGREVRRVEELRS